MSPREEEGRKEGRKGVVRKMESRDFQKHKIVEIFMAQILGGCLAFDQRIRSGPGDIAAATEGGLRCGIIWGGSSGFSVGEWGKVSVSDVV